MNKRIRRLLLATVGAVLLTGGFMPGDRSVLAAEPVPVTVIQTGDIVTADNGLLTVTYDLSDGKGDLKAGDTTIMSDFYSDYRLAGSTSRISSFDEGTRTAAWTSIGSDGYGSNGKKLTITNALASGSTLVLNLSLYENLPYMLADMKVVSGTSQSLDLMEPVAALNLDIGAGADKRIYTTPYTNNFDFGVAPVNDFGSSQNGYERLPGSSEEWTAFNGTSYWVTSVFDNWSKHGFVAGAATTFKWKSMQHLGQAETMNGPLTGFSVYNSGGKQSGTEVSSDSFFLGYFDDYRTGLETFGKAYTVAEPTLDWSGDVPTGFNTWYAYYDYSSADSMYAMTDYFADHLKSRGYEYMNLDCCYRGVQGQDIDPSLKQFVDYVHGKGMKAGTYSAPFAIWDDLNSTVPGTSYTFRDIALKDESGQPIKSYINTYIVDATHPGGQAYLHWVIHRYHVTPGFDYAKLDFIDLGMTDGAFYDSSKNGMQAYRIGMGIIRDELESAPHPVFIDESIAPLMPSGYAHGRRSGVDTTIGLESYPGIERQALNTAASWWTNGTLYDYNDPDMLFPQNVINGFDSMTLNEAKLLATTVVMGGGHLLLGDNVPFISEDRMKMIVQNPDLLALAKKGLAAKPVQMTNFYHHLEHAPAVIYLTDANGDRYVGLSNWDMNHPAEVSFSSADIGLDPDAAYTMTELYSHTKLGTLSGSYSHTLQPGESMIVKVSAEESALPQPPVNLALGKEAVASSTWSAEAGFDASKVTDGDVATRWSAEGGTADNQWIEVNFGESTELNRVVVSEYGSGSQSFQIETYALQYWDGSAYKDLKKEYTLGDNRVFDFPAVSTSKLRLYVEKARFIPSIAEIAAYDVPDNTGFVIDQDNSGAPSWTYSDIRDVVQRMQTFTLTQPELPRLDVYLYESYASKVPEDTLYVDVVELDSNGNPVKKLFSSALNPNNIPGAPAPYAVYPRLTGLDTNKQYGFILRSPGTLEDGSTTNKYGFAYSDDNTYAGGYERLSTDGGLTWSTESGGNRDLRFTVYK
ncbi:discoidin domain-containing protein [Paenibacillus physcomitrellae]|uniref:F5/8 type C domain-containing protein n=1 Tax=Paenibacillus physcomitrellae TaxID=1619311 RepID=A0ABQ1G4R4_9BACL|nr:discoidin domain-containing protein [Paenibacillus physcomitrellae]GGA35856.1 hypothetical protein GCM10010917_21300 [Paenibacillus physcomitrellae]